MFQLSSLVVLTQSLLAGFLVFPTTALVEIQPKQQRHLNRRDALLSATTFILAPTIARADDTTVDMAALNAARSKGMFRPEGKPPPADLSKLGQGILKSKLKPLPNHHAIIPIADPPPQISIRGGLDNKAKILMPRGGYSLYRMDPGQASQAVATALRAGVRQFDLATDYTGTNEPVATVLQKYLNVGLDALNPFWKDVVNVESLDVIRLVGEQHGQQVVGKGSFRLATPPAGSVGRRGRRDELFISFKISNAEQSVDASTVRRSVKAKIGQLGCSYLDLVSLHSPLTDKKVRLASYQALLDLRESGFVQAVGVCHFGVAALEEILNADLDLPAVNQLELTPFNQHADVLEWCDKYGVAVTCSAVGGDLSQVSGWDTVVRIAQNKQMSPNQVLARWALQKGTSCVSGVGSVVESSYGGLNASPSMVLAPEEMVTLDRLDIGYPAGQLGRFDGWEASDVAGVDWDPTKVA